MIKKGSCLALLLYAEQKAQDSIKALSTKVYGKKYILDLLNMRG